MLHRQECMVVHRGRQYLVEYVADDQEGPLGLNRVWVERTPPAGSTPVVGDLWMPRDITRMLQDRRVYTRAGQPLLELKIVLEAAIEADWGGWLEWREEERACCAGEGASDVSLD